VRDLGFGVSGLAFRVYGVRIHGPKGSWAYRFKGLRVQGFKGSMVQGFKGLRI